MSRIVFFSIPAWGHTNPTVEVVRQLTNRGHEVRYYSFSPFREKLEAAGADVRLCDAYLPAMTPGVEKKVGKDFSALIEMTVDVALAMEETVGRELTAFQPDVAVVDSMCIWGKLFSQKLNLPMICSTTTFAFNRQTAKLIKRDFKEWVPTLLGIPRIGKKMALLRQHGYPVKKLTDLIQNDNDTDTLVYTAREFQPMAEMFSKRYAFVGPSVRECLPDQTAKTRPLVYISLGTVMNRCMDFYRACVTAFDDGAWDVVLSVGETTDLAALGPLPEHLRAEKRVDQLAILRRADVFLTHCGMNSANEAIWCGVPTVLFPQQSEEAAVSDRMEALGLGLRLKESTPAAIRRAVDRALAEGGYREKTEAMAKNFRAAGGAERAAAIIEQIAAKP